MCVYRDLRTNRYFVAASNYAATPAMRVLGPTTWKACWDHINDNHLPH